jgi:hypothetical protein
LKPPPSLARSDDAENSRDSKFTNNAPFTKQVAGQIAPTSMTQSGSKGIPGTQYGQSDNAILKQEPQDSKPGQKRRAGTLIGVDRKGPQREVGILEPPIVSKPAFGMPLNVDPRMRGDLTEPQQRRGSKTTKESELEPTNLTPDLPHDLRAHSDMYGPSPPRSRYVAWSEARGNNKMLAPPNPQRGKP